MQPVDFTTLTAACAELHSDWVPGRMEQVYQRDRYTISLCLRTLKGRGWLTISWHPQAARIGMGDPPPRTPDTFTFSDQLRHQLGGLALVAIDLIAPWERVLDLQFARRPGDPVSYHLYVEIIGKYSNVILTGADKLIITAAHQVSSQQSSVRPIQTGQPYETPPALIGTAPSLSESQQRWQERVSLVPGTLQRQLLKSYRGLSPALVRSMAQAAELDPNQSTESISASDWQRLFQCWQQWLQTLRIGDWEEGLKVGKLLGKGDKAPVESSNLGVAFAPGVQPYNFQPGWTDQGYTVMGWGAIAPAKNIQTLLKDYYTAELNQQEFIQLHHQLSQKLGNILEKLRQKASIFEERLHQSDQADQYRQQADLLMAHLQDWKPGMKSITLADFDTHQPVTIPLSPEKNAIQNAQALYKRHQKLKRARNAVEPLLQEVQEELQYLEQVEASLTQVDTYNSSEDLQALQEIREELIQQRYLDSPDHRSREATDVSKPYRYRTPGGFELLIGRNNRQNDQLTFRTAGDYDLWFHTQEIAGSHVLLRLEPGTVADETDLQFAADLAAHYSRGRQSDQVPVVYTKPKYVYKPKGAKPGMTVYKHERVLWGQPQKGSNYLMRDVIP
ncbi:Rqc2 family fibronectin-binding protein [Allocoleopsis sp.]|uniref:Rqc2 family fibronectin-binding protein n=1 Tax=Allocoleopsis sp. TaxID=3088169 RepID=UPI002FD5EE49